MSRFNKSYDCKRKIEEAKKLVITNRYGEAKQILEACYQYYDDEHLNEEKLKLLLVLIEVYQNLKEIELVKFYLEEYEEIALENNFGIPVEIYHYYGNYWSNRGDLDQAIENFKKATKNNDLLHAANSYLQLGQTLRNKGDFEEAILAFRQSYDLFFKNGGQEYSLKVLLIMIEMIAKMRGKPFYIDIDRMASLIESIPLPRNSTTATTYLNLALTFQRFGRINEAIQYNIKTIQISDEIGKEDIKYHSSMNLATLYCGLGDNNRAIDLLKNAFDFFSRKEDTELMAQCLNQLAFIYREIKDYDKSLEYVKKSIDLSKEIVNFDLNLQNNEILADLYYLKQDFEQSFLIYNQILKIFLNLFEKTNLLGLKQIFRERATQIIDYLKRINTILRLSRIKFTPEILEDLRSDAIAFCSEVSEKELLLEAENLQLREVIKILNQLLNERALIELEESTIADICNKIQQYQGEDITPTKVKKFLIQIPDPILRHEFLTKILSRVPSYYYTKESMYTKLKSIIENLPFDEGDEIIFGVLSETWNKSQNFWSYIEARSISRYDKVEIKKTPQLLKYLDKLQDNKNYIVIFIDDVIGSGRQFITQYEKDIKIRLDKYSFLNKQNIKFYLVCGVISMEALDHIAHNSFFFKDRIKYDRLIKKRDKAFYEDNWNLDTLMELKKFLKENDPHNWDGWKKDIENDKGMEYLVVLDWRTPNSSIGILWNIHSEKEPLFPR